MKPLVVGTLSEDEVILEVKDLSVKRSGNLILKDINFSIKRGEFVGLVGPNGSGKSTLLLTLLGVLRSHQGSVTLYGHPPLSNRLIGKIGWVAQAAANLPKDIRITIRELVRLGTINGKNMFRISDGGRRKRVDKAIQMVGLEDVQHRDIARLSGGQRQRAIIARALASESEFILLDEPLVGIDRESRNSLLKLLDQLCHDEGKTILMVSHDLTAIRQTAHRMIFLEQTIRFDGISDEFPDLVQLANLRGIGAVHDGTDHVAPPPPPPPPPPPRGGRMMGLGILLVDVLSPLLEFISTFLPGEFFPYYFSAPYLQRPLLAAVMVTVVAGILGCYLLIQHLALMGDGLAHVAFGGVAVGIVLGATSPLSYALVFSVTAAVLIHEMQSREMLTGDASIAIFLTGMLALGLVILRLGGGALTTDIESYLFGNLNLIDEESLDLIALICLVSLVVLGFIRQGLLACAVDPVAARVQGLPVRNIGLLFSVTTAAVVVVMVQVVGTLLVTALLVTPAATGQLLGRSFRQCMLWTQAFGFSSVILGLYLSAEYDTGSGSMIALVAAVIFAIVAISQVVIRSFIQSDDNIN